MHYVILGTTNTPPIAYTKIIQSIVFTNYPREGIAFLLGFVWVMQYPFKSPMVFAKCPKKGIAFLTGFGMVMLYPCNILDQNNSIHGIYKILSQRYYFPSRFELLIFWGK